MGLIFMYMYQGCPQKYFNKENFCVYGMSCHANIQYPVHLCSMVRLHAIVIIWMSTGGFPSHQFLIGGSTYLVS